MFTYQQATQTLLLTLSLIILIPFSLMLPVPNPYQRIKKSVEQEPVYVSQLDSQGGNQEVDQGLEDDSSLEASVDTSETLRKINPLTIADQVSNLLRKGKEGSTLSNERCPASAQGQRSDSSPDNILDRDAFLRTVQKNPSPLSSPQRPSARENLEVESPDNAKNSDPSAGKPVDSPEGYVCQEPPRIVNKPRPKDNTGYSVIVMAGDSVKFPIKVNSKSEKCQQKQQPEVREDLDQVVPAAEQKKRLREKNSKKEFRVSKQYGKYPDFPVYDEDFNFVPDPFQGVLEENYWKDVDKNDVQKLAVPMDSYKIGEFGFEPHNILMRSNDDNGGSSRVINGIQACGGSGSSRKSNGTEIARD